MPDCWLAACNPYQFTAPLADRGPSASPAPADVHPRTGKEVYLLHVEESRLQELLDGLFEALNALRREAANAMAAVSKALGPVIHALAPAKPAGPMKSANNMPAPVPASVPHCTLRPTEETLAHLSVAIRKAKTEAASARGKTVSAAKIVLQGFDELPLLRQLLAALANGDGLLLPASLHLSHLYGFLGVQDAEARKQIDTLFLQFLDFCMAMSDNTEQIKPSDRVAYFLAKDRAMLNGALEFAGIWADARQDFEGADLPELRYVHIAAIDFFADAILKDPNRDASAVKLPMVETSDASGRNQKRVLFKHLSHALPA